MFTHPKTSLAIFSVLILAANAGTALADLPDDVQIKYYIHDDRTDPNSPIVFKVLLLMEARDSSSNSVGWLIKEAEFRQPNTDPDPDTVWTDTTVDVDTPDGLWWVDHVDTLAPAPGEFDMPPLIEGIADAEAVTGDDLDYEWEGVTYLAPPEGPPFENPMAAGFRFWLLLLPYPELEGDDEPVEIDPDKDPPLGEP